MGYKTEEMARIEQLERRCGSLESALDKFIVRYSALEWIVEQHLSHYLLGVADAEEFLGGIKHGGRPAWSQSGEGPRPAGQEETALLRADVEHLVDKVRARIREGVRNA